MGTPTTNFGWILPAVQGDPDDWGDFLNSNLTLQDTFLRSFMNTFKSNVAPAFATLQAGTMWINDTVNPWIWAVYDGVSWVTIGTIDSSTHIFVPSNAAGDGFAIGDYKYSSIASSHGKWLVCNGAAISRGTYSALNTLFSSLGYPFGDGDGVTTFNLPDLRGAIGGAIGLSGIPTSITIPWLQPTTWSIGDYKGEESHILTKPELPDPITTTAGQGGTLGGPNVVVFSSAGHGTGTVSNLGGNQSHNTMQPTVFAGNYFIFTGV